MKIEKAYNLSDIWLVPRHLSEIDSRNDVNTSIEFCGTILSLPLIASPMPDVCDSKMASILYQHGLFGFIHRFNTIGEQLNEYSNTGIYDCGCAIGINEDWFDRFLKLYDIGVSDFIIDTANGFNKRVGDCIEKMFKRTPSINLIAGNVCTKEGYRFLAQYPLAGIRCLIGSGSACATRHETSIYFPSATSLIEISQEKKDILRENKELVSYTSSNLYPVPIIADGGIDNPHDFCVALALGADVVMCGKIFAACKQSPAKTLNIDGKIKKIYRGAASFSNQIEHTGERPDYVEGFERIIDYGGDIKDIIKRFSGGLRSAMSYMNARNLKEFRDNCCFCYN